MARKPRQCAAGYAQHVVQRGNNRCVCFVGEDDYIAYEHWLVAGAKKYDIAIHEWVMMTNYAHFLATPISDNKADIWLPHMVSMTGQATTPIQEQIILPC